MRRIHLARARAGLGAVAFVASAAGCLRRDVSTEQPTTKISFETQVPQPAIDKVDVLLMIDNSSSMADKQKILARAVPDLVRGLVEPRCLDKKTRADTGVLADPLKPGPQQCPPGAEPAFKPITDMHVGVVDSSMGTFGGDVCPAESRPHNDDHARLVARTDASGNGNGDAPLPEAGALQFLAWYPDVEANRDKQRHPDPPVPKLATLETFTDAFGRLVGGVGQDGCGLEAQLESVYHFLIQPDPWTNVDASSGVATYGPPNAIDWTVLEQRAAFLRPDSLVAIILLTDEDDSSVDPLALGGHAFAFENHASLPRPTSACGVDPLSPKCASCGCDRANPQCAALIQADASCALNDGVFKTTEEQPNARFVRMKQRFGVDPQFPIARYVDGLTKPKVALRDAEHPRGVYEPKTTCTNPLFAARLPKAPGDELCALPRGPRSPALVYFAAIVGVPNQLLPDGREPTAKIDWTRIVGRDPAHLDETGLDVHMRQSTRPRASLPPPTASDDADPVSGREWETDEDDLQYACTFPLPEARPPCPDPTGKTAYCDCDGKKDTPLCTPRHSIVQGRAKAYPGHRELLVAKELGERAIVSSLCPKQLTDDKADDYGYRPAVRAISDRLAQGLVGSCLPRALEREADGSVPCLVMALLPDAGPDADCHTKYGLGNPRPELVAKLREELAAEEGDGVRALPVCEIPQIAATDAQACRDEETRTGFCYGEHDAAAKQCSYELLFTKPTARLAGARFTLQCITLSDVGRGASTGN